MIIIPKVTVPDKGACVARQERVITRKDTGELQSVNVDNMEWPGLLNLRPTLRLLFVPTIGDKSSVFLLCTLFV